MVEQELLRQQQQQVEQQQQQQQQQTQQQQRHPLTLTAAIGAVCCRGSTQQHRLQHPTQSHCGGAHPGCTTTTTMPTNTNANAINTTTTTTDNNTTTTPTPTPTPALVPSTATTTHAGDDVDFLSLWLHELSVPHTLQRQLPSGASCGEYGLGEGGGEEGVRGVGGGGSEAYGAVGAATPLWLAAACGRSGWVAAAVHSVATAAETLNISTVVVYSALLLQSVEGWGPLHAAASGRVRRMLAALLKQRGIVAAVSTEPPLLQSVGMTMTASELMATTSVSQRGVSQSGPAAPASPSLPRHKDGRYGGGVKDDADAGREGREIGDGGERGGGVHGSRGGVGGGGEDEPSDLLGSSTVGPMTTLTHHQRQSVASAMRPMLDLLTTTVTGKLSTGLVRRAVRGFVGVARRRSRVVGEGGFRLMCTRAGGGVTTCATAANSTGRCTDCAYGGCGGYGGGSDDGDSEDGPSTDDDGDDGAGVRASPRFAGGGAGDDGDTASNDHADEHDETDTITAPITPSANPNPNPNHRQKRKRWSITSITRRLGLTATTDSDIVNMMARVALLSLRTPTPLGTSLLTEGVLCGHHDEVMGLQEWTVEGSYGSPSVASVGGGGAAGCAIGLWPGLLAPLSPASLLHHQTGEGVARGSLVAVDDHEQMAHEPERRRQGGMENSPQPMRPTRGGDGGDGDGESVGAGVSDADGDLGSGASISRSYSYTYCAGAFGGEQGGAPSGSYGGGMSGTYGGEISIPSGSPLQPHSQHQHQHQQQQQQQQQQHHQLQLQQTSSFTTPRLPSAAAATAMALLAQFDIEAAAACVATAAAAAAAEADAAAATSAASANATNPTPAATATTTNPTSISARLAEERLALGEFLTLNVSIDSFTSPYSPTNLLLPTPPHMTCYINDVRLVLACAARGDGERERGNCAERGALGGGVGGAAAGGGAAAAGGRGAAAATVAGVGASGAEYGDGGGHGGGGGANQPYRRGMSGSSVVSDGFSSIGSELGIGGGGSTAGGANGPHGGRGGVGGVGEGAAGGAGGGGDSATTAAVAAKQCLMFRLPHPTFAAPHAVGKAHATATSKPKPAPQTASLVSASASAAAAAAAGDASTETVCVFPPHHLLPRNHLRRRLDHLSILAAAASLSASLSPAHAAAFIGDPSIIATIINASGVPGDGGGREGGGGYVGGMHLSTTMSATPPSPLSIAAGPAFSTHLSSYLPYHSHLQSIQLPSPSHVQSQSHLSSYMVSQSRLLQSMHMAPHLQSAQLALASRSQSLTLLSPSGPSGAVSPSVWASISVLATPRANHSSLLTPRGGGGGAYGAGGWGGGGYVNAAARLPFIGNFRPDASSTLLPDVMSAQTLMSSHALNPNYNFSHGNIINHTSNGAGRGGGVSPTSHGDPPPPSFIRTASSNVTITTAEALLGVEREVGGGGGRASNGSADRTTAGAGAGGGAAPGGLSTLGGLVGAVGAVGAEAYAAARRERALELFRQGYGNSGKNGINRGGGGAAGGGSGNGQNVGGCCGASGGVVDVFGLRARDRLGRIPLMYAVRAGCVTGKTALTVDVRGDGSCGICDCNVCLCASTALLAGGDDDGVAVIAPLALAPSSHQEGPHPVHFCPSAALLARWLTAPSASREHPAVLPNEPSGPDSNGHIGASGSPARRAQGEIRRDRSRSGSPLSDCCSSCTSRSVVASTELLLQDAAVADVFAWDYAGFGVIHHACLVPQSLAVFRTLVAKVVTRAARPNGHNDENTATARRDGHGYDARAIASDSDEMQGIALVMSMAPLVFSGQIVAAERPFPDARVFEQMSAVLECLFHSAKTVERGGGVRLANQRVASSPLTLAVSPVEADVLHMLLLPASAVGSAPASPSEPSFLAPQALRNTHTRSLTPLDIFVISSSLSPSCLGMLHTARSTEGLVNRVGGIHARVLAVLLAEGADPSCAYVAPSAGPSSQCNIDGGTSSNTNNIHGVPSSNPAASASSPGSLQKLAPSDTAAAAAAGDDIGGLGDSVAGGDGTLPAAGPLHTHDIPSDDAIVQSSAELSSSSGGLQCMGGGDCGQGDGLIGKREAECDGEGGMSLSMSYPRYSRGGYQNRSSGGSSAEMNITADGNDGRPACGEVKVRSRTPPSARSVHSPHVRSPNSPMPVRGGLGRLAGVSGEFRGVVSSGYGGGGRRGMGGLFTSGQFVGDAMGVMHSHVPVDAVDVSHMVTALTGDVSHAVDGETVAASVDSLTVAMCIMGVGSEQATALLNNTDGRASTQSQLLGAPVPAAGGGATAADTTGAGAATGTTASGTAESAPGNPIMTAPRSQAANSPSPIDTLPPLRAGTGLMASIRYVKEYNPHVAVAGSRLGRPSTHPNTTSSSATANTMTHTNNSSNSNALMVPLSDSFDRVSANTSPSEFLRIPPRVMAASIYSQFSAVSPPSTIMSPIAAVLEQNRERERRGAYRPQALTDVSSATHTLDGLDGITDPGNDNPPDVPTQAARIFGVATGSSLAPTPDPNEIFPTHTLRDPTPAALVHAEAEQMKPSFSGPGMRAPPAKKDTTLSSDDDDGHATYAGAVSGVGMSSVPCTPLSDLSLGSRDVSFSCFEHVDMLPDGEHRTLHPELAAAHAECLKAMESEPQQHHHNHHNHHHTAKDSAHASRNTHVNPKSEHPSPTTRATVVNGDAIEGHTPLLSAHQISVSDEKDTLGAPLKFLGDRAQGPCEPPRGQPPHASPEGAAGSVETPACASPASAPLPQPIQHEHKVDGIAPSISGGSDSSVLRRKIAPPPALSHADLAIEPLDHLAHTSGTTTLNHCKSPSATANSRSVDSFVTASSRIDPPPGNTIAHSDVGRGSNPLIRLDSVVRRQLDSARGSDEHTFMKASFVDSAPSSSSMTIGIGEGGRSFEYSLAPHSRSPRAPSVWNALRVAGIVSASAASAPAAADQHAGGRQWVEGNGRWELDEVRHSGASAVALAAAQAVDAVASRKEAAAHNDHTPSSTKDQNGPEGAVSSKVGTSPHNASHHANLLSSSPHSQSQGGRSGSAPPATADTAVVGGAGADGSPDPTKGGDGAGGASQVRRGVWFPDQLHSPEPIPEPKNAVSPSFHALAVRTTHSVGGANTSMLTGTAQSFSDGTSLSLQPPPSFGSVSLMDPSFVVQVSATVDLPGSMSLSSGTHTAAAAAGERSTQPKLTNRPPSALEIASATTGANLGSSCACGTATTSGRGITGALLSGLHSNHPTSFASLERRFSGSRITPNSLAPSPRTPPTTTTPTTGRRASLRAHPSTPEDSQPEFDYQRVLSGARTMSGSTASLFGGSKSQATGTVSTSPTDSRVGDSVDCYGCEDQDSESPTATHECRVEASAMLPPALDGASIPILQALEPASTYIDTKPLHHPPPSPQQRLHAAAAATGQPSSHSAARPRLPHPSSLPSRHSAENSLSSRTRPLSTLADSGIVMVESMDASSDNFDGQSGEPMPHPDTSSSPLRSTSSHAHPHPQTHGASTPSSPFSPAGPPPPLARAPSAFGTSMGVTAHDVKVSTIMPALSAGGMGTPPSAFALEGSTADMEASAMTLEASAVAMEASTIMIALTAAGAPSLSDYISAAADVEPMTGSMCNDTVVLQRSADTVLVGAPSPKAQISLSLSLQPHNAPSSPFPDPRTPPHPAADERPHTGHAHIAAGLPQPPAPYNSWLVPDMPVDHSAVPCSPSSISHCLSEPEVKAALSAIMIALSTETLTHPPIQHVSSASHGTSTTAPIDDVTPRLKQEAEHGGAPSFVPPSDHHFEAPLVAMDPLAPPPNVMDGSEMVPSDIADEADSADDADACVADEAHGADSAAAAGACADAGTCGAGEVSWTLDEGGPPEASCDGQDAPQSPRAAVAAAVAATDATGLAQLPVDPRLSGALLMSADDFPSVSPAHFTDSLAFGLQESFHMPETASVSDADRGVFGTVVPILTLTSPTSPFLINGRVPMAVPRRQGQILLRQSEGPVPHGTHGQIQLLHALNTKSHLPAIAADAESGAEACFVPAPSSERTTGPASVNDKLPHPHPVPSIHYPYPQHSTPPFTHHCDGNTNVPAPGSPSSDALHSAVASGRFGGLSSLHFANEFLSSLTANSANDNGKRNGNGECPDPRRCVATPPAIRQRNRRASLDTYPTAGLVALPPTSSLHAAEPPHRCKYLHMYAAFEEDRQKLTVPADVSVDGSYKKPEVGDDIAPLFTIESGDATAEHPDAAAAQALLPELSAWITSMVQAQSVDSAAGSIGTVSTMDLPSITHPSERLAAQTVDLLCSFDLQRIHGGTSLLFGASADPLSMAPSPNQSYHRHLIVNPTATPSPAPAGAARRLRVGICGLSDLGSGGGYCLSSGGLPGHGVGGGASGHGGDGHSCLSSGGLSGIDGLSESSLPFAPGGVRDNPSSSGNCLPLHTAGPVQAFVVDSADGCSPTRAGVVVGGASVDLGVGVGNSNGAGAAAGSGTLITVSGDRSPVRIAALPPGSGDGTPAPSAVSHIPSPITSPLTIPATGLAKPTRASTGAVGIGVGGVGATGPASVLAGFTGPTTAVTAAASAAAATATSASTAAGQPFRVSRVSHASRVADAAGFTSRISATSSFTNIVELLSQQNSAPLPPPTPTLPPPGAGGGSILAGAIPPPVLPTTALDVFSSPGVVPAYDGTIMSPASIATSDLGSSGGGSGSGGGMGVGGAGGPVSHPVAPHRLTIGQSQPAVQGGQTGNTGLGGHAAQAGTAVGNEGLPSTTGARYKRNAHAELSSSDDSSLAKYHHSYLQPTNHTNTHTNTDAPPMVPPTQAGYSQTTSPPTPPTSTSIPLPTVPDPSAARATAPKSTATAPISPPTSSSAPSAPSAPASPPAFGPDVHSTRSSSGTPEPPQQLLSPMSGRYCDDQSSPPDGMLGLSIPDGLEPCSSSAVVSVAGCDLSECEAGRTSTQTTCSCAQPPSLRASDASSVCDGDRDREREDDSRYPLAFLSRPIPSIARGVHGTGTRPASSHGSRQSAHHSYHHMHTHHHTHHSRRSHHSSHPSSSVHPSCHSSHHPHRPQSRSRKETPPISPVTPQNQLHTYSHAKSSAFHKPPTDAAPAASSAVPPGAPALPPASASSLVAPGGVTRLTSHSQMSLITRPPHLHTPAFLLPPPLPRSSLPQHRRSYPCLSHTHSLDPCFARPKSKSRVELASVMQPHPPGVAHMSHAHTTHVDNREDDELCIGHAVDGDVSMGHTYLTDVDRVGHTHTTSVDHLGHTHTPAGNRPLRLTTVIGHIGDAGHLRHTTSVDPLGHTHPPSLRPIGPTTAGSTCSHRTTTTMPPLYPNTATSRYGRGDCVSAHLPSSPLASSALSPGALSNFSHTQGDSLPPPHTHLVHSQTHGEQLSQVHGEEAHSSSSVHGGSVVYVDAGGVYGVCAMMWGGSVDVDGGGSCAHTAPQSPIASARSSFSISHQHSVFTLPLSARTLRPYLPPSHLQSKLVPDGHRRHCCTPVGRSGCGAASSSHTSPRVVLPSSLLMIHIGDGHAGQMAQKRDVPPTAPPDLRRIVPLYPPPRAPTVHLPSQHRRRKVSLSLSPSDRHTTQIYDGAAPSITTMQQASDRLHVGDWRYRSQRDDHFGTATTTRCHNNATTTLQGRSDAARQCDGGGALRQHVERIVDAVTHPRAYYITSSVDGASDSAPQRAPVTAPQRVAERSRSHTLSPSGSPVALSSLLHGSSESVVATPVTFTTDTHNSNSNNYKRTFQQATAGLVVSTPTAAVVTMTTAVCSEALSTQQAASPSTPSRTRGSTRTVQVRMSYAPSCTAAVSSPRVVERDGERDRQHVDEQHPPSAVTLGGAVDAQRVYGRSYLPDRSVTTAPDARTPNHTGSGARPSTCYGDDGHRDAVHPPVGGDSQAFRVEYCDSDDQLQVAVYDDCTSVQRRQQTRLFVAAVAVEPNGVMRAAGPSDATGATGARGRRRAARGAAPDGKHTNSAPAAVDARCPPLTPTGPKAPPSAKPPSSSTSSSPSKLRSSSSSSSSASGSGSPSSSSSSSSSSPSSASASSSSSSSTRTTSTSPLRSIRGSSLPHSTPSDTLHPSLQHLLSSHSLSYIPSSHSLSHAFALPSREAKAAAIRRTAPSPTGITSPNANRWNARGRNTANGTAAAAAALTHTHTQARTHTVSGMWRAARDSHVVVSSLSSSAQGQGGQGASAAQGGAGVVFQGAVQEQAHSQVDASPVVQEVAVIDMLCEDIAMRCGESGGGAVPQTATSPSHAPAAVAGACGDDELDDEDVMDASGVVALDGTPDAYGGGGDGGCDFDCECERDGDGDAPADGHGDENAHQHEPFSHAPSAEFPRFGGGRSGTPHMHLQEHLPERSIVSLGMPFEHSMHSRDQVSAQMIQEHGFMQLHEHNTMQTQLGLLLLQQNSASLEELRRIPSMLNPHCRSSSEEVDRCGEDPCSRATHPHALHSSSRECCPPGADGFGVGIAAVPDVPHAPSCVEAPCGPATSAAPASATSPTSAIALTATSPLSAAAVLVVSPASATGDPAVAVEAEGMCTRRHPQPEPRTQLQVQVSPYAQARHRPCVRSATSPTQPPQPLSLMSPMSSDGCVVHHFHVASCAAAVTDVVSDGWESVDETGSPHLGPHPPRAGVGVGGCVGVGTIGGPAASPAPAPSTASASAYVDAQRCTSNTAPMTATISMTLTIPAASLPDPTTTTTTTTTTNNTVTFTRNVSNAAILPMTMTTHLHTSPAANINLITSSYPESHTILDVPTPHPPTSILPAPTAAKPILIAPLVHHSRAGASASAVVADEDAGCSGAEHGIWTGGLCELDPLMRLQAGDTQCPHDRSLVLVSEPYVDPPPPHRMLSCEDGVHQDNKEMEREREKDNGMAPRRSPVTPTVPPSSTARTHTTTRTLAHHLTDLSFAPPSGTLAVVPLALAGNVAAGDAGGVAWSGRRMRALLAESDSSAVRVGCVDHVGDRPQHQHQVDCPRLAHASTSVADLGEVGIPPSTSAHLASASACSVNATFCTLDSHCPSSAELLTHSPEQPRVNSKPFTHSDSRRRHQTSVRHTHSHTHHSHSRAHSPSHSRSYSAPMRGRRAIQLPMHHMRGVVAAAPPARHTAFGAHSSRSSTAVAGTTTRTRWTASNWGAPVRDCTNPTCCPPGGSRLLLAQTPSRLPCPMVGASSRGDSQLGAPRSISGPSSGQVGGIRVVEYSHLTTVPAHANHATHTNTAMDYPRMRTQLYASQAAHGPASLAMGCMECGHHPAEPMADKRCAVGVERSQGTGTITLILGEDADASQIENRQMNPHPTQHPRTLAAERDVAAPPPALSDPRVTSTQHMTSVLPRQLQPTHQKRIRVSSSAEWNAFCCAANPKDVMDTNETVAPEPPFTAGGIL